MSEELKACRDAFPPVKQAMQEFITSSYLPASGWTAEQFKAAQEATSHWLKYENWSRADTQLAEGRATIDALVGNAESQNQTTQAAGDGEGKL